MNSKRGGGNAKRVKIPIPVPLAYNLELITENLS
jgi:hypothetical protein